jgi:hypothetical protein
MMKKSCHKNIFSNPKKYIINKYTNTMSDANVSNVNVESEPFQAGGKRVVKKATKTTKKTTTVRSSRPTKKEVSRKTSRSSSSRSPVRKTEKKVVKTDKKTKRPKKGGAFVDDVKNLAVPFAILLAKEGLTKVFADKKKKSAKEDAKKTTKSSTNKRTLKGGSCNAGCTMSGGAAHELVQLQNKIDAFLQKY